MTLHVYILCSLVYEGGALSLVALFLNVKNAGGVLGGELAVENKKHMADNDAGY